MLVFYIVLSCSLLFGLRVRRTGYFGDFLDREQTDAIKGFFIWMVFIAHVIQEVRVAGFDPACAIDTLGYRFRSEFGQLIVVMFLFYSGYGVMESIKNKGCEYLNSFPRRRLLTTLLNFDIAVLCFIVLNLFMGVRMDLKLIGWTLIGWESAGNSNWYIFVILFCYLVTWISGKCFPDSGLKMVLMASLLIIGGEVALSFLRHGQIWWYNTILCYPAGLFLSYYKERVKVFFQRYYVPLLGLLLTLFLFLHFQRFLSPFRGLTLNIKGIVFALIVTLLTMKIKIGNRFLYWSGACLFPIYIYQRLPMRALQHYAGDSWVCGNPYLFILLCAITTGGIAYFYKHWQIKLK